MLPAILLMDVSEIGTLTRLWVYVRPLQSASIENKNDHWDVGRSSRCIQQRVWGLPYPASRSLLWMDFPATKWKLLSSWSKGGNTKSAGWQVILYDLIWHVSSHSGVATLWTAISLLFYLTFLYFSDTDKNATSTPERTSTTRIMSHLQLVETLLHLC